LDKKLCVCVCVIQAIIASTLDFIYIYIVFVYIVYPFLDIYYNKLIYYIVYIYK